MAAPLTGLRLLIVEDNYLIASLIRQIFIAAGCIVPEPIPKLMQAQYAARHGDYDAAILDIDLNGEQVYPVSDILSGRNIPHFFLSGYGYHHLPLKYSGRQKLGKPFKQAELLDAVTMLVNAKNHKPGETPVRLLGGYSKLGGHSCRFLPLSPLGDTGR